MKLIANYTVEGVEQSTLSECIEYCRGKPILGLDIETSRKFPKSTYSEQVYKGGLDPYLTNICMIQIGDLQETFIIDARDLTFSDIKVLRSSLFEREDLIWVGHNLRFEYMHLKHNYNFDLIKCWDTMLCDQILYNGLDLPMGLADLSQRYLGAYKKEEISLFTNVDKFNPEYEEFSEYANKEVERQIIDKSTRLGFIDIGDKPFTYKQITYGNDDIINPLLIKQIQEKGRTIHGEIWNPIECFRLENEYLKVIGDISLNGMNFHPERWIDKVEKDIPIFNELKEQLDNWVIQNEPMFTLPIDLFTGKPTCGIQWSSSKQVISLFRKLNICPKEKSKQTKRMEWSVGNKALAKTVSKENKWRLFTNDIEPIESLEDLIIVYLRYKRFEQSTTTFGMDFLKYVHPITGRLHSNYRQILNTARLSSTNPNLQNIPSDKASRECFQAPEGSVWINCDYSAMESRVIADINNEVTMCDFFNNSDNQWNNDFHCYVATLMQRVIQEDNTIFIPSKEINDKPNPEFKKEYKTFRDNAKAIGFKLGFGGSAFTLKDDFGVDEEEAQKFIDGYFNAFPSLRDSFEKRKKDAFRLGYIEIDPITKRRWFFKEHEYMLKVFREAEELKDSGKKVGNRWSIAFSLKSQLERKSLNYPVQSTGASQHKLAGIYVRKRIKPYNGAYIATIHDESLVEGLDKFKNELKTILETSMVEGANVFTKHVNMDAAAVISNTWEH